MYADADGNPAIQESVLLYLDELGTKARLPTLNDDGLRASLRDYKDIDHWFIGDPDLDSVQRSLRFSDNTVVASPVTDSDDGGAFNHVSAAAHYQFALALRGHFLRGAITRGPVYIASGYVTGQALAEAVLLEETQAIFPRVLLQRSLWHGIIRESQYEAIPSHSPYNQYVLVDSDGELFVNYLGASLEELMPEDPLHGRGIAARHRDAVAAKLDEHANNEHVRRKYAWTAGYHNWVCAALFDDPEEFLIGTSLDHLETTYPRTFRTVVA
ncbi:hypothetical protein Back2_14870 [Nocardioides baekrokdamisoli]|uniref:Uncharacterized protein n=1 Tax=Nocardioides baekrokdamisoli TaxID=1804624 RepID=A0A3G9IDZ6_9ACTN|nr:hypothetical protein [Nocardioides baekrokdamisoli]BBH17200.1 hypothetical protein Back2_14870 [Nocardioides baekrokdamisoli]